MSLPEQSKTDIKEMPLKKLLEHLLTLDYKGIEFKQECLKEILRRNTTEGEIQ